MKGLLNNTQINRVLNRNAGTPATISSDIEDMKGFDDITWIVAFQDVVNASVLTVQMQEGAQSDLSDATTVAAADKISRTAGASDVDNKLMVYECLRPAKRYVRLQVVVATQNAPIDAILAIKSRARKRAVTQPADVLDSKQVATPTTS